MTLCVNSTDPQLVRQKGSWRFIYIVQDSTGLCLGRGGLHCCWVGAHRNQKSNSRYLEFLGIRDLSKGSATWVALRLGREKKSWATTLARAYSPLGQHGTCRKHSESPGRCSLEQRAARKRALFIFCQLFATDNSIPVLEHEEKLRSRPAEREEARGNDNPQ